MRKAAKPQLLILVLCVMLMACRSERPQTSRLHSNTDVSTFSEADCDLAIERSGWLTNYIKVPPGNSTNQLPRPVQEFLGARIQQTQQGAAYISLLAMKKAPRGEARKQVENAVRKEMSQQELWDSTTTYINAEIEGAPAGSYVSRLPKSPPGTDNMPQIFDSFEKLNMAYIKDVLLSSHAISNSQADTLSDDVLQKQFTALLQKSGCR